MIVQQNFIFCKEVSAPVTEPEVYHNHNSEVISVEIHGTFTSGSFIFEGKTDVNNANWTPISGINLSDFSTTSEPKKAGIWEVGIEGITVFRVRIVSLSGGSATVFGKVVKTGV